MYSFLDLSTANSGLGTPLRSGGQIINDNFLKLHAWMQSRSNIAAYSIPTLAAGGPAYLLAVEFSPGNPMPLTVYKRRSAAPTDTANPGYVRSPDGQWWELLTQGADVYLEQFGGKADYSGTGTGGTDNYPAFQFWRNFRIFDPIGNGSANSPAPLRLLMGRYKVNQKLMFWEPVRITGSNIGLDAAGYSQATQLHFKNSTGSYLVFMSMSTGPDEDSGSASGYGTSYGSLIEGFAIHGDWDFNPGTVDYSHCAAVRARTKITCNRITVVAAKGIGFHVHATAGGGATYPMEGNANEFVIRDCYVHSAGQGGIKVAGMDVNAGKIDVFTSHYSEGFGIYAAAGLGITIDTPQITGYGGYGVSHLGRRYQYINGDHTIVPGTNDYVWHYLREGGVSAKFPAWNAGDALQGKVSMPIAIYDAFTVCTQAYVEIVQTWGHSESLYVHGGTAPWTSISAHKRMGVKQNLNFTDQVNSTAYGIIGGYLQCRFGGAIGENWDQGVNIFSTSLEKHTGGTEFTLGHRPDHTLRFSAPGASLIDVTTLYSTATYGAPFSDPYRLVLYDPIIKSRTPPYDGRTVTWSSGQPTYPGYYADRSIFYDLSAVAGGYVGRIVTTAGAIHSMIWASGAIGGGEFVRNGAGRIYRHEAFGNSTIEPTHTSGTQTLADGNIWTWVANGPPAFKRFGAVET